MTGLTHATGVSLAPTQRLNIGANTDIGTLRDVVTGAETKRTAAGLRPEVADCIVRFQL